MAADTGLTQKRFSMHRNQSGQSSQPRRRKKVNPRSQPNSQPRRRKSAGKPPRTNTSPWWLLAELKVDSTMESGPLRTVVLHPTLFPDTPYATQCAHHTHRIETRWHLDIRVTTASTTGVRAAVLFMADPRMGARELPSNVVWSAVLNGQGTIATSTGNGQTKTSFRLPHTTQRLSNAAIDPSLGANLSGFSSGAVCIHLLDPPIGLTNNTTVNITILARVELRLEGPITGFMAWSSTPIPGPGPGPHPAPQPTDGFTVTIPVTDNIPLNSHTASAWLAGGEYWQLPGQPGGDFSGSIWTFSIYQNRGNAAMRWQNNDQAEKEPRYFVTWEEPGSGVLQVVGFENYQDAYNQATGHTGLVPHGAECCITYNNPPVQWQDRFQGLTGLSNPAPLRFDLVLKAPGAKLWWKGTGSNATPRSLPDPHFPNPPQALLSPERPGAIPHYSLSPASYGPVTSTQQMPGLQSDLIDLRSQVSALKLSLERLETQSVASSQSPLSKVRTWLLGSVTSQAPPSNCSELCEIPPLPQIDGAHCCTTPSQPSTSDSRPLVQATPLQQYCYTSPTSSEQACPGCDNPACDYCFEDASDDGTEV